MVRLGVVAGAFAAGAITVLLALYVALRMAPGVITANDMMEALVVVADPPLARFPNGSVVYVQSAVGPMLLERLHVRHPTLRLLSFAARPEEHGCQDDRSSVSSGECQRDDFVKLEVLSSPTPRTMLVAIGTSRTFGQVLLLNIGGRWRVLVDRRYLI